MEEQEQKRTEDGEDVNMKKNEKEAVSEGGVGKKAGSQWEGGIYEEEKEEVEMHEEEQEEVKIEKEHSWVWRGVEKRK